MKETEKGKKENNMEAIRFSTDRIKGFHNSSIRVFHFLKYKMAAFERQEINGSVAKKFYDGRGRF